MKRSYSSSSWVPTLRKYSLQKAHHIYLSQKEKKYLAVEVPLQVTRCRFVMLCSFGMVLLIIIILKIIILNNLNVIWASSSSIDIIKLNNCVCHSIHPTIGNIRLLIYWPWIILSSVPLQFRIWHLWFCYTDLWFSTFSDLFDFSKESHKYSMGSSESELACIVNSITSVTPFFCSESYFPTVISSTVCIAVLGKF